MAVQQDKYAQMQFKLREGQQILVQASGEDSYQLGVALLKLHAALEDFFRLEIARKAPSLRMEVEDPGKTSWNELIRYGKQYLRLTEEDARIIVEANRQRMSVAQGGNFEGSRQELARYAKFVERWCNQGKLTPGEPQSTPVTILRKPYERPRPASHTSPRAANKSWYRSRLFFLLAFFLMPPLWAALIITDRHQAWWARFIGIVMLSLEVFVVLVLLNPTSTLIPDSLDLIRQQISSPTPLPAASSTPEKAPLQNTTPVVSTVTPLPATNGTCTVVWAEFPGETLAGKNRSMVWAEIVLPQVARSGMTAREFYNEVLVRNPHLVRDGYEFKNGETYLLPRCE